MTPPGGIPKNSNFPTPHPSNPALNCKDDACYNEQVEAGVLLLETGQNQNAKDVFKRMEECASAGQNIKYELLARGLVNLSEGDILAAQRNLQAIYDHPYAHRLLQVISHHDDQVVQLQTLHLLHNLVYEEKLDHPDQENLKTLLLFLEQSIEKHNAPPHLSIKIIFQDLEADPTKNFKGMTQVLENLSKGLGKEILETRNLNGRNRASTLFQLIDTQLIPQKRIGTAYMIAKMYQKDPEYGDKAIQYILRFEGLSKDYRWTATDFLDEGASYFAISLLALGAGRLAFRGSWALLTRNAETLSLGRQLIAGGISLGISTTTYFLSEKALLGLAGFDGKIWPNSGSELGRELGADLIVMGLSNLMGAGFTWTSKRYFKPLSNKIPRMIRFLKYSARSPLRLGSLGLAATTHTMVLYGTHRWEDNIGMIDRFRKGKPLRWLPQEWVVVQHDALEVLQAKQVLRRYLANSSQQTENVKSDEIYHQIHDLKRWIRELNGGIQDNEKEEQLLGIFWIAKACGQLNESAQDHLLKWVKEKRYDKVNQYLFYHQIPLQISEEVKILTPLAHPLSPK